jgi:hypothetical protein
VWDERSGQGQTSGRGAVSMRLAGQILACGGFFVAVAIFAAYYIYQQVLEQLWPPGPPEYWQAALLTALGSGSFGWLLQLLAWGIRRFRGKRPPTGN